MLTRVTAKIVGDPFLRPCVYVLNSVIANPHRPFPYHEKSPQI